MLGNNRDVALDQANDVAQEFLFLVIAEGEGFTRGTGTTSTADAVYVGLRDVRDVKVDHVREPVDVDAACRDIGSDQRAQFAFFEAFQRALAGALALVAVDGFGSDTGLHQHFRHFVRTMFGAGEDQRFADGVTFQEVQEQLVLVRAIHHEQVLIDGLGGAAHRSNFHLDGIGEDAVGQLGDLLRHGSAEEQGLALGRQLGDHLLHIVDEAHVQHAVGFVQYEDLQVVQVNEALLHQVQQTAGCSHYDIHTTVQRVRLWLLAHATEDHGVAQLQVTAVSSEALADLDGQLARRRQDQVADGAFALRFLRMQLLQDRDSEGSRFTGTGLCAAEQIAPFDQVRNGLFLDRRRVGIAFFLKCFQNGLDEPEVVERSTFHENVRRSIPARDLCGALRPLSLNTPFTVLLWKPRLSCPACNGSRWGSRLNSC